MKRFHVPLLALAGLAVGVAGCDPGLASRPAAGESLAQGVLFSVEYQLGDGRTGGFTRLNDSRSVPGGNGSWNVDAHGRLTADYLFVTYPRQKDLGPRAIPAHRLIDVQFGDGGIENVSTGSPATGH